MRKSYRETFKVAACMALMSAALIMGGCTPSGNLISKEKPKVDYVTPTPIPEETATPSPSPAPTATPAPSGSLTPTAIPASLPILVTGTPADSAAYYTTANVNVRSEASVNGAILGGIAANTKIDVQEIVGGEWARIEYNGKTGYINTKYLVSEELYDPSNATVTPAISSEPDRNQDNQDRYSSNNDDDYYEYSGGGRDGGTSDYGDGNTSGSGDAGADGASSDGGAGDGGSSEGGGDDAGASEGGDDGGGDDGGADEGGADDGGDAGDGGGADDGGETFDEL
ncbi:MAG: SH3 domain-containing protein [Lachnospiraceae bacterium]|nr:SH3 domain-containing protein [Lachnospiraceae bacterium]